MLSVQNLTGGYSRHQPVIHHISLNVQPSEIVGLIGVNGAGKSTTIKHILGLLTPHEGTIEVDRTTLQADPLHYRSSLAYIPEVPQFYEELTLWEHLELTARAYQLPKDIFKERAEFLLQAFRMKKATHWFPHTFSKGMQQKIMILCAFLIEPKLLIVDEPFIGLDPLAIQALLDLFLQRKKEGTAILMSTHILTMAEKYCDRFVLLHEGQVALSGTLPEMREQAGLPRATLEELFIQIAKDS
ncbi:ABC transporter ATP-binding protein [Thermoflavimicrobium daqui]|jgi:ABC-2 type transport system ATP-binding protein|uniref:Multidrug ABC transporter ATP-binding protein n=1 Tax=Thermoflavimicrobium daqui TaxID=2137476 RepID=A0A364K8N4_9BACL|nr:ABC transporter ATP-binding protein [Thermoflavimicrobium daqui]RAL26659.1 multidrug ABC transporter ATP-binding protein [Thermoflavimicrobium daqui]